MELIKDYKDISETMSYMKRQIQDSLDYANEVLPDKLNSQELFNWLKLRTTFVNDPKGIELLQTMQTLFSKKGSGVIGGGDCDCFVITVTACCNILNIPSNIVLVGRSKKFPVHIYNTVKYGSKWQYFDLTEPFFNMKRPYPYQQIINSDLIY